MVGPDLRLGKIAGQVAMRSAKEVVIFYYSSWSKASNRTNEHLRSSVGTVALI